MEGDMEVLALMGQAAGGFGLFLFGIAAIWFVSVYLQKKE
jgi:hypothetical protein